MAYGDVGYAPVCEHKDVWCECPCEWCGVNCKPAPEPPDDDYGVTTEGEIVCSATR